MMFNGDVSIKGCDVGTWDFCFGQKMLVGNVWGKHWKLGTFWRQKTIHRKPLETKVPSEKNELS